MNHANLSPDELDSLFLAWLILCAATCGSVLTVRWLYRQYIRLLQRHRRGWLGMQRGSHGRW